MIVISCKTGRSKCFGFVLFETVAACERALAAAVVRSVMLDGQVLNISAAHKEADSSTPDASARHATDDAAPPRAMSAAERHFEREKAARKERETRRREKLMTREAERQQREERQRASGGRSQGSSTPEGSRTPQPGIYS